jgi:hypothetical protein
VRSGRKVRVKIGDTYVEVRTAAEVESVLKSAAEFKRDSQSKKIDPP